MVSLFNFLFLSIIVFSAGLYGVINGRRSVINVLMSIELILLASNINFIAFATFTGDIWGQIFTMFVLIVAAAEAAIALAILVVYFRKKGNISTKHMNEIH